MSPLARALSLPVHAYRAALSPLLGPRCRFDPTCSAYALEALARHGALRGGWMALRRVARCHPWGGWGVDDVPREAVAIPPRSRRACRAGLADDASCDTPSLTQSRTGGGAA